VTTPTSQADPTPVGTTRARTSARRLARRRRHADLLTRAVVAVGGAAVVAAIAMIFVYLVWVVAPVFAPATIGKPVSYPWTPATPRLLASNDSPDRVVRIAADGRVAFLDLKSGRAAPALELERPIRLAHAVSGTEGLYAVLSDAGALAFLQVDYPMSFEDASRRLGGTAELAFEGAWLDLGAVTDFDAMLEDGSLTVASLTDRQVTVRRFEDAEPDLVLAAAGVSTRSLDDDYQRIWLGPRGDSAYVVSLAGPASLIALPPSGPPNGDVRAILAESGVRITAVAPLLGRVSLLVADDQGRLAQWFPVRGDGGVALERIREFGLPVPAVSILPEHRRKGFAALDADGGLHLFYTTAPDVLTSRRLGEAPGPSAALALAPRADALFVELHDGRLDVYPLHNPYPEISFAALWHQVWYEGYDAPVFSWQSSSADNDFEPKFSLVPLLFGTVKAALYAMLIALPLAVLGAVYTGYFMAPTMRAVVKPGIEILAALPTVVLGFLAGLWLAPLIESHLASVLTVFWALPLGVVAVSALWAALPDTVLKRLDGWYGLVVLPFIVVTVVIAFTSGPTLETVFFGGNAQAWLLDTLGLDYDQRNALVVGIAMGLAVVPTIFSISEDAIQGVPSNLVNASLALGATRWQTLVRVVLLAASPGIFSGMIMGFGRAVGETMIVLMATGNTPIMDWNVFEGMRTFAANIAVELPESEVDSSHYRILFLTALVLFAITFLFNTVAELIRQRLRERYARV